MTRSLLLKSTCMALGIMLLIFGVIYSKSTYAGPPAEGSARFSQYNGEAPEIFDADEEARLQLISDFWRLINEGKWLEWAELYTPVEREDRLALVRNEQNYKQHVGILTITHAELLETERVDNSYAPWIYSELQTYFEDESAFACYRLRLELEVAEENEHYKNGECRQLIVLIKDAGSWGIGALTACPDSLLAGDDHSSHENPYYAIKSKQYNDAYIVFPTNYVESLGSDAPAAGSAPFDVSFVLPKGWTYRENDGMDFNYLSAWQQDGLDHSIVLIYNSYNACVGAIGYSGAAGQVVTPEALFADLDTENISCSGRNGIISVTRQLDTPASNQTFISRANYLQYPASEGDAERTVFTSAPLILSYSAENEAYIVFEFDASMLGSLQLMDIAESIRIYRQNPN